MSTPVFRVKLFARAKELAGTDCAELVLTQDGPVTVGRVRRELGERFPNLKPVLSSLHFAVGTEYADDSRPVNPDDELACFPPVSGG